MEQNNATSHGVKSPFLQSHSATIRLWHWISFILIAGSIITVLLNTTLLNPRKNGVSVQGQLQEQGIVINERQAFFVAHQFDDKLWNLHRLIGFCIAIMLAFRILAELLLPKEERMRARMCSAVKLVREGAAGKGEYQHYLIVKYSYLLFYMLIFFMAVTGLVLAFEHQLEFLGNARRTIKEIHGTGQWVMYAFVLFHVGGVILSDLGKAKGIVSGMINGNK